MLFLLYNNVFKTSPASGVTKVIWYRAEIDKPWISHGSEKLVFCYAFPKQYRFRSAYAWLKNKQRKKLLFLGFKK